MIKSGPPGSLGPHVVGQRVVVRRVLPGQTGPSGGPAMTDLLGICESWGASTTTIRAEDGTLVEIRLGDIVSGKPVPPRPSRFSRIGVEEVQRRGAALFRPLEVVELGGWLLRYSGGQRARANSVLPVGDPGVPVEEALAAAVDFYRAHDRRPCVQAVVSSPLHEHLEDAGWVKLRPDEADSEAQLAGVARLARALADIDGSAVTHADAVSPDWLVGNEAALANYPAVERALRLDGATFAEIRQNGVQVARARVNVVEDWAFLADLTVQPHARGRGLARAVLAGVTAWAAERGASVMMLQVVGDNEPALGLYRSLGFEVHHRYRYLTTPD